MKPEQFKVGVRFKYMGLGANKGNPYSHHIGVNNEVLRVNKTAINGLMFVVANDIAFNDNSDYAKACVLISEPPRTFTLEQVEQIRKEAFEAGRGCDSNELGSGYCYADFDDYKKQNPL